MAALVSLPLLIGVVTSWDTAAAAHRAPGAGPIEDHLSGPGWVTTWGGSAMSPSPLVSSVQDLNDQTVRDIVYTSVGGDAVRIRVTNAFGDRPLTIGGASVARQLRGAGLDPATTRRLTFGGSPSVRVPKGGAVLSDPVAMRVPAVSNLAVSLYAPESVAPATYHQYAQQTNYLAAGDHVGDAAGDACRPRASSTGVPPPSGNAGPSTTGCVRVTGSTV